MFCTRCGRSLSDNARFCPQCGNPLQRQDTTKVADASIAARDVAVPVAVGMNSAASLAVEPVVPMSELPLSGIEQRKVDGGVATDGTQTLERVRASREPLSSGVNPFGENPASQSISPLPQESGRVQAQVYPQPWTSHVQPQVPTQPYVKQTDASQVAFEKSKMVAGLLALFLGILGTHKFYLGYASAGVAMLLTTIVGSPVLIGLAITALANHHELVISFNHGLYILMGPTFMVLISLSEAIAYLSKSDADFQRIYVWGSRSWF